MEIIKRTIVITAFRAAFWQGGFEMALTQSETRASAGGD
jgi:hypothetical protein